jgi:serine/threonine-protein kinase RsbW
MGKDLRTRVEISLPASADYLYLVRLHIGAIAAHAGMTVEDVEDLRLAVDELCLSLLTDEDPLDATLHVATDTSPTELEVRCRRDVSPSVPSRRSSGLPTSLSAHILDALVDKHGSSVDGGVQTAWLIKCFTRQQGAG